MTPASKISMSMMPLVVSTLATTSPRFTLSPGFTSQVVSVALSMSAPSEGITKSAIGSGSERAPGGGDDRRHLRQRGFLEVLRVRDRHLDTADALERRVEVVERILRDPGHDLGREAAAAPALVDDHGAMRLAHRRKHGRRVERPQAPKVDDLGADAAGCELARGRQRLAKAAAVRHERDVR